MLQLQGMLIRKFWKYGVLLLGLWPCWKIRTDNHHAVRRRRWYRLLRYSRFRTPYTTLFDRFLFFQLELIEVNIWISIIVADDKVNVLPPTNITEANNNAALQHWLATRNKTKSGYWTFSRGKYYNFSWVRNSLFYSIEIYTTPLCIFHFNFRMRFQI